MAPMPREPYEPPAAEDEPIAIPAPSDEVVTLRVVAVTVLILGIAAAFVTRGFWLDALPEGAGIVVGIAAAVVGVSLSVWLRRARGLSLGANRRSRRRPRNRSRR